eukprot:TRINITY_DN1944_c0_g1_i2.p1 TRINITY_DN1944_c0_g1~~TRINITY_DN1944_c0_g1_i2.p1  ORF type:complete len:270 (+),score=39.58 TRINITY_DN1944_c0_g1_i2:59-868(+)
MICSGAWRALLFCLLLLAGCSSAIQVTTNCGVVEGITDSSLQLASFLSIPYGSPPVRWMPPTPAQCWKGVFNATEAGVACWNYDTVDTQQVNSEDCLHLNVHVRTQFIPAGSDTRNSSLKPVLFWIYGGSNIDGSKDSYPNLHNLALFKDFVVVAANYRLGPLGFLALPQLSSVDPRGVSGNYGILDIQLALRWVQQNIARFGGDSNRVTLLGQSSGGTNIFSLLASPASKGLFHAAISLSGSPNITMDLPQVHSSFITNEKRTKGKVK